MTAAAHERVLLRRLPVPDSFSLTQTCGPAAWVGERSPRHRWLDGTLTWIGWEDGRIGWRHCRQPRSGMLDIRGTAAAASDRAWASAVLGVDSTMPSFGDPLMSDLAREFSGLRAYCDGSLFDGIVTSIVGQSISVAAAAVAQARLAASFASPITLDGREFRPLPRRPSAGGRTTWADPGFRRDLATGGGDPACGAEAARRRPARQHLCQSATRRNRARADGAAVGGAMDRGSRRCFGEWVRRTPIPPGT